MSATKALVDKNPIILHIDNIPTILSMYFFALFKWSSRYQIISKEEKNTVRAGALELAHLK